jgi:hypothetical protein
MPTDKQLAANRANAAKSTGPRTPEGKAISSRNSSHYGRIADTVVLQSECPARFRAFLDSFYCEYQPATPTEIALVDTMAGARWRLMRMSQFESAIIDHEYAFASEADSSLAVPTRASLAWRRAVDSGRSVEITNRAEARLTQQFNSSLELLRRVRLQRVRLEAVRRHRKIPAGAKSLRHKIPPQIDTNEPVTQTEIEK